MTAARPAKPSADVAALVARVRNSAPDDLPDELLQDLLGAAIQLYIRKREAGSKLAPFVVSHGVTQTEAAIMASEILKAGDVEIFELAMWNTWGEW